MAASQQPPQPAVNTPPLAPEAAAPLAQATPPAPAETVKPFAAATPVPPAETVKPGLTAATLALVMDWRHYWYVDLFLLVLFLLTLALLMLLWLLPSRREIADYETARPAAMALVSRPPSVRSTNGIRTNGNGANGIEPALFASTGITIGRGGEFCDIRFVNQGHTPVTFEDNCLVIGVGRVLLPTPSYPADAVESAAMTVAAGQQFSIKRPNPVSEQDWERIKRGEAGLWLFGYIDYHAGSGAPYRQGFCFNYQPPTATYSPPNTGRVVATGPRAYTYVMARDDYPRGPLERGEAGARENLVH
jgi:hypothetical protein